MNIAGTTFTNGDFGRIALVVGVSVFSAVALAGVMNKNTGSFDRCIINRSSLYPPGYVFSLVWTLLYIGYILTWLYVVRTPRKDYKEARYDRLYIIGLIIIVAWTVITAFTNLKWLSDLIMFILITFSIYAAYYVYCELSNDEVKDVATAKYRPAVVWYFILLALWAIFATYLSLTTKLVEKCKWSKKLVK
jgi:benzodiazapine receptor